MWQNFFQNKFFAYILFVLALFPFNIYAQAFGTKSSEGVYNLYVEFSPIAYSSFKNTSNFKLSTGNNANVLFFLDKSYNNVSAGVTGGLDFNQTSNKNFDIDYFNLSLGVRGDFWIKGIAFEGPFVGIMSVFNYNKIFVDSPGTSSSNNSLSVLTEGGYAYPLTRSIQVSAGGRIGTEIGEDDNKFVLAGFLGAGYSF